MTLHFGSSAGAKDLEDSHSWHFWKQTIIIIMIMTVSMTWVGEIIGSQWWIITHPDPIKSNNVPHCIYHTMYLNLDKICWSFFFSLRGTWPWPVGPAGSRAWQFQLQMTSQRSHLTLTLTGNRRDWQTPPISELRYQLTCSTANSIMITLILHCKLVMKWKQKSYAFPAITPY